MVGGGIYSIFLGGGTTIGQGGRPHTSRYRRWRQAPPSAMYPGRLLRWWPGVGSATMANGGQGIGMKLFSNAVYFCKMNLNLT
jgi:hypothetical protein